MKIWNVATNLNKHWNQIKQNDCQLNINEFDPNINIFKSAWITKNESIIKMKTENIFEQKL